MIKPDKSMKSLKLSPQLSNTRHQMASSSNPSSGNIHTKQQQLITGPDSAKLPQTITMTLPHHTSNNHHHTLPNPHHHHHAHHFSTGGTGGSVQSGNTQWKLHIQQPSQTGQQSQQQQITLPQHIQVNPYLLAQLQNHMKQSQNHLVCTCPPEVHKALLEQQLVHLASNSTTAPTQTTTTASTTNSQPKLFIATPQLHSTSATNNSIDPKQHQILCTHPHLIQQQQHGKQVPPPYTSVVPTISTVNSSASVNNNSNSLLIQGRTPHIQPHHHLTDQQHNLLSNSLPSSHLHHIMQNSGTNHSRQSSVPETIVEARAQISRMESQLTYLTSWIQAHAGSLTHNTNQDISMNSLPNIPSSSTSSSSVAGNSIGNSTINPNDLSLTSSSGNANSLQRLFITTGPNNMPYSTDYKDDSLGRNSNEANTPSNSSLESTYSFRSSNTSSDNNNMSMQPGSTSDNKQKLFIVRHPTGQHMLISTPNSGINPDTSSTPIQSSSSYLPYTSNSSSSNSSDTAKSLISTQYTQLMHLKQELSHIRHLNQSMKLRVKESINETFGKLKILLAQNSNLNVRPIRLERIRLDDLISEHCSDVDERIAALDDLEIAIEDLRMSVLDRRCRVNVDEVEVLALHLSRISKSLANSKADIPNIEQSLTNLIDAERNLISNDENFLTNQPKRLESSLKLCKKLISTLFTLKRLGSVQDSADNESIPEIRTTREVSANQKRSLMASIRSIEVNNDMRMQKIEQAEKLRICRKKMVISHESLKFEKSLELASKALRDTNSQPPSTPPLSTHNNNRDKSPLTQLKLNPSTPSTNNKQPQHHPAHNSLRESDSMSSLNTDSDQDATTTTYKQARLTQPSEHISSSNKQNEYRILPTVTEQLPISPVFMSTTDVHDNNTAVQYNHQYNSSTTQVSHQVIIKKSGTATASSSSDTSDTGGGQQSVISTKRSRTILKTGQNSSRSNRSSKVAFNRQVMVEDGSEYLQLNCLEEECCSDSVSSSGRGNSGSNNSANDEHHLYLDSSSMIHCNYSNSRPGNHAPPPPPRLSSQDDNSSIGSGSGNYGNGTDNNH